MNKKYDSKGREIQLGDIISQINYNGELYQAVYRAEIDPCDNELAFVMIEGNERAMAIGGLADLAEKNGKLKKGIIINR